MRPTRFESNNIELTGAFTGKSENPLIVLVHGLCGDSSEWATAIGNSFNQYGLSTLRFDLAGHGQSQGESVELRNFEQNLADVKSAIAHARSKGYERIGVLGNSYGGLLALHAGIGKKLPVGAQSPVWNYEPLINAMITLQEQERWKQTGTLSKEFESFTLQLPYVFKEQAPSYNGLFALNDSTQPIYVVHGDKDELAPHQMSAQAGERENVTLVTYEKGDHRLDNHRDDIHRGFARFFNTHLRG